MKFAPKRLDTVREHVFQDTKNQYKSALVLCVKSFACPKYVVFLKTDVKTDRLCHAYICHGRRTI